ncbi:uncharacterized protein LOC130974541 [Arachis stenosperma]|uniref:uncharacterized protein LOC130974541 n=1 Tax=Arachis stenosperma TaxID=217475 RepID=UPI0025AC5DF6|nr:uncharacterized protein LOC130974541 [Arachis stenosperma]
MGQDHRRLDSKVIAQHIFTIVKADPTSSIRVLQEGVENHFDYKVSYRKVLGYNLSHNLGLVQSTLSCFIGFFGGTLLMAIVQDGNANIFPIAFVIVEGETKEALSFFLLYLWQHVTLQPDVLVISDRHKLIDTALNAERSLWKPPHAFQACRTRHIAANFMTHFKNKDLKKFLVNVAYSKSQWEFAHYFGRLRGENVAIINWLEEIPRSHWTQYADEGRRFGHMMTNISECINAVMKGSRNLPITALVKSSYFCLGKLFARKSLEALTQLQFDRSRTTFTIEELTAVPGSRQQNYQVLLDEGKYDCGYFQTLHVPCRHILAACSHARLDWKRSEFRPIGHEDDCSSYDGAWIQPNPKMMRVKRVRPVNSMIRNNMDDVEHNGEKKCELCRQVVHMRRTCTALDGGGALSSRR